MTWTGCFRSPGRTPGWSQGQVNAVRPAPKVLLDMVGELVDAWMTVDKFLAN